jgi:tetraacyldisaccharide 4'-kinase
MQALGNKIFWVLLLPLSFLWAGVTFLRRQYYTKNRRYQSPLKVIGVGNIHSGGSGKTPLVKAIADHFSIYNPMILSRGYRGKLSSRGAQLDLSNPNGSYLYGDEPWMLANQVSGGVFISKNRVAGIKQIEQQKSHELVILDDGFQHLALGRNVDIVAINTGKKLSDNFCLPMGELREPLAALNLSDAVVLTPGEDEQGLDPWLRHLNKFFPDLPVFVAKNKFLGFFENNRPIKLNPSEGVVSFCGIASPKRFIVALKQFLPDAIHIHSFPDHYKYSQSDVEKMIVEAGSHLARTFVTTDKDWYKVNRFFVNRPERILSLRNGFELDETFWFWLEAKVGPLDSRCRF